MSLTQQDLSSIAQLIESSVGPRFDVVNARLDKIDSRLDGIDARLDRMDEEFRANDAKFFTIEMKFESINERFDTLEGKIDQIIISIDGFMHIVTRHEAEWKILSKQHQKIQHVLISQNIAKPEDLTVQ